MKSLILCLMAMLLAGGARAQVTWTIDKEHSSINFAVSHFAVGQTVGRFKDFDAKVVSKTDNFTGAPGTIVKTDDFNGASLTFTAKTASIETDNDERDEHLQSDDFLDSKKYPDITFAGTLTKEGDKYWLKGNLTIRDVTKPVAFPVAYTGRLKESKYQVDKAAFVVTGTLSRAEYGLKWNQVFEGGGAIVGDQVTLTLQVEINRQK